LLKGVVAGAYDGGEPKDDGDTEDDNRARNGQMKRHGIPRTSNLSFRY